MTSVVPSKNWAIPASEYVVNVETRSTYLRSRKGRSETETVKHVAGDEDGTNLILLDHSTVVGIGGIVDDRYSNFKALSHK